LQVFWWVLADGGSPLLIAITGWGQSHDRAKAAEAGFDQHLTKPIDFEKLSVLLSSDLARA
jgi:CheY-like chemotaxis protein